MEDVGAGRSTPPTDSNLAGCVPDGAGRGQPPAGFPSTFPPPDARPRGTARNGQGRQVTAEAADGPFAHVTSNERSQAGMRGDVRGAAGATYKTAGFAYTGSNPVPATPPLSCGNGRCVAPVALADGTGFPPISLRLTLSRRGRVPSLAGETWPSISPASAVSRLVQPPHDHWRSGIRARSRCRAKLSPMVCSRCTPSRSLAVDRQAGHLDRVGRYPPIQALPRRRSPCWLLARAHAWRSGRSSRVCSRSASGCRPVKGQGWPGEVPGADARVYAPADSCCWG